VLPPVLSLLGQRIDSGRRIIDVGCGNGSFAAELQKRGWDVVGIDPSESAIRIAQESHPSIPFYRASAYDDLASQFGQFPVVLSLEVVEHVYDPRRFARTIHCCVQPGGIAILSTPYHGYLKNLSLAILGQMDRHFTALWDHGHIKFWSISTLGGLLREAGFGPLRFLRVGRIPWFAKSMIAVASRDT
jgi:2-polyprenyl-6-hydroxyphenyl methylase/3-demethylubiquinone-9 3-methyltransferase